MYFLIYSVTREVIKPTFAWIIIPYIIYSKMYLFLHFYIYEMGMHLIIVFNLEPFYFLVAFNIMGFIRWH